MEIKSKSETIAKMERDMKEMMMQNRQLGDLKLTTEALDEKIKQKNEEIGIMRDTIKTLYEENERLSAEKNSLLKEASSAKEALATLKKKYKRLE